MADAIGIRPAAPSDLSTLLAIYGHHVETGLASFELAPPSLDEFTTRYQSLLERGYFYVVAVASDEICGYGYVGPYRPRPAYRYTVENSVYVAPGFERRGVGRSVLAALIEQSTELGFRRMVAVIGDSENWPSIRLHEALGFVHAGTIPSVGIKFGRWVDSVIMQRALGEGDSSLPSENAESG